MLIKKNILGFFLIASSFCSIAQNEMCNGATRFCTDTTYNFPAPVTGLEAEVGPDYGCLGSQPNPTWYYLKITDTGTIVINIAGQDAFLDDVDFACWGPFTTPTASCSGGLTADCDSIFGCRNNTDPIASYPLGNLADCSYDVQATEVCTIHDTINGHYYIIMVTNYGGNVTNIILTQTNAEQIGAGRAACRPGNVGLENELQKKEFSLYPNPNKGKFTICLGDINDAVNLRITNLLGEIKHEQKLNTNITELNLDLISGMYLISIEGENTNLQYKVIVD